MKNKILFLLPASKGKIGGGKRLLAKLICALKNYQKLIILNEGELEFPYEGELITLNSPPSFNLLIKAKRFIERVLKVRKIKKEFAPEISLSLMEGANFINLFSHQGEKIILSTHTDLTTFPLMRSFIGKVYKFLIKFFYKKADLIVAISKGVANSLINLGVPSQKIKVIYGFLPLQEIEEKAKEEIAEIFSNSEYLINVGRLSFPKGQWFLLRIFRELKKDFPKIKLLILGDGELRDYLFNFSKKLGLKTFIWDRDKISENFDVYFLGFKENPFKFISKARLFIFTSLYEGFSIALVEALACKAIVISSDCKSGPREILAPKTDFQFQTNIPEFAEYGILMPVFQSKFIEPNEEISKEEKIWIETIKEILTNPKIFSFYSEKAKKRALDFDEEKIVEEWVKILK